MQINRMRRQLIGALTGAWVTDPGLARRLLQPTPAQTAGPFYPVTFRADDDSDLTRVRGGAGTARGQVTELWGRIVDANGGPLGAARVELWQCDANGRYRHPRDRTEIRI